VLDPFYMIVDNSSWIGRLLPCGVRLVQLRIKDAPDDVLRAEILKAKALCAAAEAQLVVNDYWRHAIDAGCDFVHLGQDDLALADLTAIRRAGIKLGVSTHDHDELDRALEIRPDYIALGPIYPTILKAMAFGPQGLPRLSEWKKRIGRIPLVGIGGVTLERVAGVLEAGADSAAVVTDITRNADPEQRARDWAKTTRAFARRSAGQ
jgi:thiamine-phosphate pyrophosphorylase